MRYAIVRKFSFLKMRLGIVHFVSRSVVHFHGDEQAC
jgi:hypothetical protein